MLIVPLYIIPLLIFTHGPTRGKKPRDSFHLDRENQDALVIYLIPCQSFMQLNVKKKLGEMA